MMDSRPAWLEGHPKDLIFKFDLESKDLLGISSKNEFFEGLVWYRRIEIGFEIDYIEIPLGHRGKGLGSKLLDSFINFCRNLVSQDANSEVLQKGVLNNFSLLGQSFEIWLEVSALNPAAISLYKSHGFSTVGKRPKYYQDGSDALLMSWTSEKR